jgi:hypothetical protein
MDDACASVCGAGIDALKRAEVDITGWPRLGLQLNGLADALQCRTRRVTASQLGLGNGEKGKLDARFECVAPPELAVLLSSGSVLTAGSLLSRQLFVSKADQNRYH